ncbi:MAG: ThuA domain-containing protein [Pseudomonadota bacterium]
MKRLKFAALFLLFQVLVCADSYAQKQFKVLMVTTTRGWHHESIHMGVLAVQKLAERNSFDLVLLQDPKGFTDKYVEQFHAILFLNTTGDIFTTEEQGVMERFIRSGKGFIGVHSASDTEHGWDWYTKLVGRMFHTHPPVQTARLRILGDGFPGLQGFPDGALWTDEWYEFGPEKVPGLTYILGVDEGSFNPKPGWETRAKAAGMGRSHALSWFHHYDGGRSFYTALGHLPASFNEPAFLNHLYAGIFWAATGRK